MNFSSIRSLLAKSKFTIGRGQQYISQLFWAITISNVILVNIKDYVELSLWQYLLVMVIGTFCIVFGVWLIGYIDVRFRFYSTEIGYAQKKQPVLKKIHDNTEEILKRLK